MFTHDEYFQSARLSAEARALERNYTIQPNDRLNVKVYTNNGERIIDPDFELNKGLDQSQINRPDPEYVVQLDGKVNLPMIGNVDLSGMTLYEANIFLSQLYGNFFTRPYVITTYTNKRVTVLGATGGQIISLIDENITVAEVIAIAGGLENKGKASGITLIRGKEVFIIDFSTIEGYYDGNQIVLPGDIIYVEPIKRFLSENSTEVAIILSTLTSITTLLVLLFN